MKRFLLFPILLVSCVVSKSNQNTQQADKDEIMFLIFSIQRDSVMGKNKIELISKVKSAGTIKKISQENHSYENYLTFEVNEKGKPLNTIILDHPLYKKVEYLDGDTLTTRSIVLDKQEFFIRLQLHGDLTQIKIIETLKNAQKKEVTTIKL